MLTGDMLSILCCPTCRAHPLRTEIERQEKDEIREGLLICDRCAASYPVHSGVPDLIPYPILGTAEWEMWKNHLEYFQSRREYRGHKQNHAPTPNRRKRHQAFFDFAGITTGKVLDIGCGPGKLRHYLNEKEVHYYGLDPIPLVEAQRFKYVRALAEHIPFQDSSFSHLLTISSLDHFHNLKSFFKEASRVLKGNGTLHLLQSIHGGSDWLSKCKDVLHKTKDAFDRQRTGRKDAKTPKHMREFTTASLLDTSRDYFEVISTEKFNQKWYMPSTLFISMRCISPDARDL